MSNPQALADLTQEQLSTLWDKATPDQRVALRRRAQTDLYFLVKVVLNEMPPHEDALNERVHGEMCDLFVKKDPDKPIFDQCNVKERLLLAPRGTLKTEVSCADIVQWIICFPGVRILILSGTQDLAQKMVTRVRDKFIKNALMRKMFPECCLDPKKARDAAEFYEHPGKTGPAPEKTLELSTIGSTKASSHYHIIKCDDVQNDSNCKTPAQLQNTWEEVNKARYLLFNGGGYVDYIGTRWGAADIYQRLLDFHKSLRDEELEAGNSDPEETLKTCILAAWTLKAEANPPLDPLTNVPKITEADVDLLLPKVREGSFKFLHREFRRDPYHFACQRLMDPNAFVRPDANFDLLSLERHTIPFQQLPTQGYTVYAQWDLAGSNPAARNDRSVGVIGYLSKEMKLYIIDMVAGRWPATQKAGMIVELAHQYRPVVTYIEDAFGSKDLEPTIISEAQQKKVMVPLIWPPAKRKKNSKADRVSYLNQLLKQDRLWFAADIRQLDELYKEFTEFGRASHDDIPDAIAQLVMNVMMIGDRPIDAPPVIDQEKLRQQRLYQLMFPEEPEVPRGEVEQVIETTPLGYGF